VVLKWQMRGYRARTAPLHQQSRLLRKWRATLLKRRHRSTSFSRGDAKGARRQWGAPPAIVACSAVKRSIHSPPMILEGNVKKDEPPAHRKKKGQKSAGDESRKGSKSSEPANR
jgi:hypothetical protein